MPSRSHIRQELERLIAESEELEDQLGQLQDEDAIDRGERTRIRRTYLDWYSRASQIVNEEHRAKFKDMYEGGSFISRMRSYLEGPLDPSPLYDAEKPGLFPKFKNMYAATGRPALAEQRALLVQTLHQIASSGPVLLELAQVLRRFPEFLRTVRRYDNPQVPTPAITNEAGLQVAVHAILRLLYSDVREEDFVSQHAGGSSRVDFFIAEAGVLVETKMTRPGLRDRKVGEELLIDWGRYKRHPDCKAIFAMVYDPERYIDNHVALETSLTDLTAAVPTLAIVVY